MEFELVEMTPEQREMALYEEAVEHFGEKAKSSRPSRRWPSLPRPC